ncbi:MAG: hypothetical protein A2381_04545 [Bdellovibrionales bacterium RIFOXYB1_FULL_37_110]|nr:MAG: hypothetical protein A2417_16125 [Bdellovibrionales bacterium RIFOXYC1_FULL_37_79]OFZ56843.1 MAG: hypothetical protein A2328_04260 [Bdellovibrionales bacterium RIFOXYB2_FULL_36_6]OFZ57436.1 MAG: hypothetical protein A2381_04545 [Bdellovibrionales bacterium RIFOXYB1_FULL_37_110]OFZ64528.1 MAG: hypothetical protein A2577_13650 [Bdellovibrionales bacterium RIFOXYD1_FULL_36_51]
MKVAIIGTGKTGSKVVELLQDSSPGIFNTTNPPTLEKLKKFDVIITFVPGTAFQNLLKLLLDSQLPVVSGATGFNFPNDFHATLIHKKLRWIHSNNFSLGINLIQPMLKALKKTSRLFADYHFTLHETHHVQKKDAPSGTSQMWQAWLGEKINITSERTGDVVGTHCLTLNLDFEKITLTHEALDRKIFAQGAIYAAHELLTNKNLEYGLLNFTTLVKEKISEEETL